MLNFFSAVRAVKRFIWTYTSFAITVTFSQGDRDVFKSKVTAINQPSPNNKSNNEHFVLINAPNVYITGRLAALAVLFDQCNYNVC